MEPVNPSGIIGSDAGLGLNEADLDRDPIRQFELWFMRAVEANLPEPNAMTLATATPDGIPSARIVLLKGFDHHGFLFFTNYDSQKGRELARNPHVALVLFWPALERQVRIIGQASRESREESEHYFHSRPLRSQLGAVASHQSQLLPNRDELDRRVDALAAQYASQPVPLPSYWGGYRVTPESIEFWQARPNRLHDRFRYTRADAGGGWLVERLSP